MTQDVNDPQKEVERLRALSRRADDAKERFVRAKDRYSHAREALENALYELDSEAERLRNVLEKYASEAAVLAVIAIHRGDADAAYEYARAAAASIPRPSEDPQG